MSSLDYLSDLEKDKIIAFNQDIVLVNAVKKVLLEAIYNNGVLRAGTPPDPLRNVAFGLVGKSGRVLMNGIPMPVVSNEQLGEDLRATYEGINLLEQGLTQLALIKKDPVDEVSSTVNEAI